jgi:hypothetical protein|nr:MAG TPA: hypothetical protein [Caudoviricetes sp.]
MDLIKKELKNKYPNCRIKLEIILKTPQTVIYHYIINSNPGYQVATGSAMLKDGNITIKPH